MVILGSTVLNLVFIPMLVKMFKRIISRCKVSIYITVTLVVGEKKIIKLTCFRAVMSVQLQRSRSI